ncbi:hypothetical protein A3C96_00865 [Candidatus Uhrbacteria bacterium RIFCSPHIGHO2_02_FULL_60_10]|uniref:Putative pre-16S rRNA nuclease n=1 Tax=Candidatus Uhrbacteria bacterium RIFCSPHIGHO2_02_FULL_60_10 TaxID=1802392 RepID=A0A1F7U560_9BACT|nr:MAG: hypothetical protein A3C96_00865 [Candidatus Uhrbacteria bacterium RIFCSPHIGHO2_02_FULL_60_10]
MRILGIDYGTKRIGLAVGETDSGMSFPLRSVDNHGDLAAAAASVVAAAKEEDCVRFVIGMPTSLRGGESGETAVAVKKFAALLKQQSGLEVDTEDERLTTAMVEKMRKDAGIRPQDFDRDAAAASVILESWLARHRSTEAG